MEKTILDLEKLFKEKLFVYKELLLCLEMEKENLTKDFKIDLLWKHSEEKQNLSSKIEKIRSKILAVLNRNSIYHNMNAASFNAQKIISFIPQKLASNILKIHISLISVKNEVYSLAHNNRCFVEESLGFVNELIAIMTDSIRPDNRTYGNGHVFNRDNKANVLIHKKV